MYTKHLNFRREDRFSRHQAWARANGLGETWRFLVGETFSPLFAGPPW